MFFKHLLKEDWTFKTGEEIREVYKQKEIDIDRDIVFSCGSGVTACVDMVGAQIAKGKGTYSVYDGSWTEYATKVPKE